jgi:hypothetical protein
VISSETRQDYRNAAGLPGFACNRRPGSNSKKCHAAS